jgi:hypothetical protein
MGNFIPSNHIMSHQLFVQKKIKSYHTQSIPIFSSLEIFVATSMVKSESPWQHLAGSVTCLLTWPDPTPPLHVISTGVANSGRCRSTGGGASGHHLWWWCWFRPREKASDRASQGAAMVIRISPLK